MEQVEAFQEQPEQQPKRLVIECECRRKRVDKRTVVLYPGVDPEWFVGTCLCGRQHVRRVGLEQGGAV